MNTTTFSSFFFFFLMIRRPPISTLFPSRRSSDLPDAHAVGGVPGGRDPALRHLPLGLRDRKSTRLNSSHPSISYAVFCLKKKIYLRHNLDEALQLCTCDLLSQQLIIMKYTCFIEH